MSGIEEFRIHANILPQGFIEVEIGRVKRIDRVMQEDDEDDAFRVIGAYQIFTPP